MVICWIVFLEAMFGVPCSLGRSIGYPPFSVNCRIIALELCLPGLVARSGQPGLCFFNQKGKPPCLHPSGRGRKALPVPRVFVTRCRRLGANPARRSWAGDKPHFHRGKNASARARLPPARLRMCDFRHPRGRPSDGMKIGKRISPSPLKGARERSIRSQVGVCPRRPQIAIFGLHALACFGFGEHALACFAFPEHRDLRQIGDIGAGAA